MAIYIPASRRRRRLVLFVSASLAVGVILGVFGGRATAPSVQSRVSSGQEKARVLAAGLRVLELHQEAGTGTPDGSIDLALQRTGTGLKKALGEAPWVPTTTRAALLDAVAGLKQSTKDSSSASFATKIEALATSIEAAFGLRGY